MQNFPEYDAAKDDENYANPNYYRQQVPVPPRTVEPAQPTQPVDSPYTPYGLYGEDTPYIEYPSTSRQNAIEMREYRHPREIVGYTDDIGAEQREAAAQGKVDSSKRKRGWAGLGGIGATIVAFLLKFSFLLKFGLAGITALISVAIYAFFLGWPFAIGLVALLFIHEMGHAIVMRLKGIPVGAMIFVPLLGAAVTMRQMPQNARDEAEVGIAGPIAGSIAASVCLLLARTDTPWNTLWASLAYFGFFMNLFNLIPIVPFDGGRVLAAIDRRIWIIGFIGLLAFQIWSWIQGNFSIWLLFFLVMAGTQLWSRGITPDTPQAKAYYNVPISTRIVLSLAYFGLAAVLVLGMSVSRGLMPVLN